MSHLIEHTDCMDAELGLPSLADQSVDHVITDPPYSEHTHKAQRQGATQYHESASGKRCAEFNRVRDLGFEYLGTDLRLACAEHFARIARRWVLVFCDHEGSHGWAKDLANAGLDYVRTGIWRKLGSTPQFTGDRPATGHECIVIAHRKGRKKWNGGGKHGVWTHPIVLNRGKKQPRLHTTQKPLALMEELVRDFTDPGDLILDPFAGSGTTIVAAKRYGRNAIGMERDEKYAKVAAQRVAATSKDLFATAPQPSREQTAMFDK